MPLLAVLVGFAAGRKLAERNYVRQLQQHGSYQQPGSFLSLLK